MLDESEFKPYTLNDFSTADDESENTENQNDDNDYLEQKWKKIASDFNKNYNLDISASEFKDNSFSETLKKLEAKTGKSSAQLQKEIRNWK